MSTPGADSLKCQYTLVAYPTDPVHGVRFFIELRPQLVSGHENLQSDGFMVEVDGKYIFLDNSQKFQHHFSKRNVVSLGIPSDFTSEWITLFSNRKMTTRYLYRPVILARQPADKL